MLMLINEHEFVFVWKCVLLRRLLKGAYNKTCLHVIKITRVLKFTFFATSVYTVQTRVRTCVYSSTVTFHVDAGMSS